MDEWSAYVRRNLKSQGLDPHRHAEMVEELARQLEDSYAEATARGLSRSEAMRATREEIPDWEALARQLARTQPLSLRSRLTRPDDSEAPAGTSRRWPLRLFADLGADLRYGVRMAMRSGGFTTAAVLTLALGIGATTAIFSVVDGVLLRPLPYEGADRMVALFETTAPSTTGQSPTSPANFLDWQARTRTLEALTAATLWRPTLTGFSYPDRLNGLQATTGLFELLSEPPLLGRTIQVADGIDGQDRVVVLSYDLWQRQFGGDPEVLDRVLSLDDEPYTVIGIMPQGFQFPPFWAIDVDVWSPLVFRESATLARASSRDARFLRVFARRRAGVSLEQARREMQAIGAALEREYSEANEDITINLQALHEPVVGDVRPALLVLLGTVGFVLLIACANVANLLLARGTARRREFALRAALGAGAGRLMRQLLAESAAISALGGAVGIALGMAGTRALIALAPPELPRIETITVDARVLGVAIGLTVLSALGFGLAPALRAARTGGSGLPEAARVTGGRESQRVQQALVVAQIGLALVLLVGAGLLASSFVRLRRVDPGFATEGVVTMAMQLGASVADDPGRQTALLNRIATRVEAIPGVTRAGFIHILHLGGDTWTNRVAVDGGSTATEVGASVRTVTTRLFDAMQITLLQGRVFDDRDTRDGSPVAIVNRTFAEQVWPDENPLGRRVRRGGLDSTSPWRTVVGVVDDVHQDSIANPVRPEIYFPYSQNPFAWSRATALVVRGEIQQLGVVDAVRRGVWAIDPELPITRVRTSAQLLDDIVARERFTTWLLGLFAATALTLAIIGIHGVIAYTVSRRTRELGIRVALGATRGDVLSLVVRQGVTLAALGTSIGMAGALLGAGALERLLFGVAPTDPATLLLVAFALFTVASLACVVAARPALGVQPVVALRQE